MTAQAILPTSFEQPIPLSPGPLWGSYEKFRTSGQAGLGAIVPGTVGTLVARSGQYRIMTETDFQKLLGLARDVERLRGGLRVVLSAAQAVQRHRDEVTVNTLIQAVAFVGDVPALPIVDQFGPLKPEGFEIDPDDEVILNPAALSTEQAAP